MELSTKEIQVKTLEIVKQVDFIAKKLDLKYALMWGTLLGAVRHAGFIPWDDDFDIMMSRRDYNILMDYFKSHKEELEPLVFFSKETRIEYPYMIGRICDTRYHLVSENEKDYGMGIFIDIYPLDGAGNGEHSLTYFKACLCCTLLGMKSRLHFVKTFSVKKNILKYMLYGFSKLVSEKKLIKNLVKYSKKYRYEDSDFLCCMQWMDGGQVVLFPKNIFNTIETNFEGILLPIPVEYDEILRKTYGDYLQLPPENERIGHHYYKIYSK